MENRNNLIKIELHLTQSEVENLFGTSIVMMTALNHIEDDGLSVMKKIYEVTSKIVSPIILKETREAMEKLKNSQAFDYALNEFGTMITDAAFTSIQKPVKKSKKEVEDELQEFALLPEEEQSKLADGIFRETFNNEDFLKTIFLEIREIVPDRDFLFFQKSSIANLAFISLKSPEPYRTKAQNILLAFKKWLVE